MKPLATRLGFAARVGFFAALVGSGAGVVMGHDAYSGMLVFGGFGFLMSFAFPGFVKEVLRAVSRKNMP